MSHVYVGKQGRHTICLSSNEIGCLLESLDEFIRFNDGEFPNHIHAMMQLYDKMMRYYSLVHDLEEEE